MNNKYNQLRMNYIYQIKLIWPKKYVFHTGKLLYSLQYDIPCAMYIMRNTSKQTGFRQKCPTNPVT